MRKSNLFLILMVLTLLAACNAPAPAPTLTNEPGPPRPLFVSPTVTAAAPTATPIPPEPTPIPSLTPAVAALNPDGPYVLFSSESGIWITNPDGSALTLLTAYNPGLLDLHDLLSPDGSRLALKVPFKQGFDLVEVRVPSGEMRTLLINILAASREQIATDPTSPAAIASYAVLDYPGIAWQPNGSLLAFTAAIGGPTSDLYGYDFETEQVYQYTDGPAQAVYPSFSPDGRYILHYGVSWKEPFGGAITGYNRLDGVWAVRVSDREVIDLPKPRSNIVPFAGWLNDANFLTYDSDEICYGQNLREVQVMDGDSVPMMLESFYYAIALSPLNQALLFSGAPGCPTSPGEGIFLLPPNQPEPVKLADKRAYEIRWLPESGVFLAYPEALFSANGQTRYDPPVYDHSYLPAVSKQGYQAWEVIENRQGRVLVNTGVGWSEVLYGLVAQLIWDPLDGNTLLIVTSDGTLYAATAPDFTPRPMGQIPGTVSQAIWAP